MATLPPELLGIEVFGWLSDADWARCQRVCKRWHEVTPSEAREERLYGWKLDRDSLWRRRRVDGALEVRGFRKKGKAWAMKIVLEELYCCGDDDES